jgi:hypothetical protein
MTLSVCDIGVMLQLEGDFFQDSSGDLAIKTGKSAIQQYLQMSLIQEQGRYRFDPSFGSHLYTLIGHTSLTKGRKEQLAKLYILNCLNANPFVSTVDSIKFSYEPSVPGRMIINIVVTLEEKELTKTKVDIAIG